MNRCVMHMFVARPSVSVRAKLLLELSLTLSVLCIL